jgi:hypothetical protein
MIWDRSIIWRGTGDARNPWNAETDGKIWTIRINEFPADDHLYTLLVDGEELIGFSEWPLSWVQPETRPSVNIDDAETSIDLHEQATMNAELEWVERVAAIEPSDKIN